MPKKNTNNHFDISRHSATWVKNGHDYRNGSPTPDDNSIVSKKTKKLVFALIIAILTFIVAPIIVYEYKKHREGANQAKQKTEQIKPPKNINQNQTSESIQKK